LRGNGGAERGSAPTGAAEFKAPQSGLTPALGSATVGPDAALSITTEPAVNGDKRKPTTLILPGLGEITLTADQGDFLKGQIEGVGGNLAARKGFADLPDALRQSGLPDSHVLGFRSYIFDQRKEYEKKRLH